MSLSVPQALFLGVIQGITEFLPISSSGHLVVVQYFIGLRGPVVLFDVFLHIGTLGAVIVFFRKELSLIIMSIVKFRSRESCLLSKRRIFYMVILGMLPTVAAGLFLQPWKDVLFQGVVVPGTMLLLTGTFLWFADSRNDNPGRKNIRIRDALMIGLMQGVAILPGISRSGITISTGLLGGMERKLTFRYSFFLFIPAALGALVLEGRAIINGSSHQLGDPLPSLVGTTAAFLVGMVALKVLQNTLKRRKLSIFSWYCWILGAILLLSQLIR